MKRLTLVRHAKSSWKETTLDDFDRPLNKRGRGDAPMMGRRLADRGIVPDRIIASPALRALSTAEAVASGIGVPRGKLVKKMAVYLASVPTLVDIIRDQEEAVHHLMLVGHNPGLTDLANFLAGSHVTDNIPTCGIVCLDIDAVSWKGVAGGVATVMSYDYPKKR